MGPLALARATPNGLPRLPRSKEQSAAVPYSTSPRSIAHVLIPTARPWRSAPVPPRRVSRPSSGPSPGWPATKMPDGRWDAGIARHADGTPVKGDDDYTVHCPPGEPCAGECLYWEADTALTGLSLLAFLGSGYTHTDGKYSDTVGRGLEYLRMTQKARRRPPRREPVRRDVLPRHGDLGTLRSVRPDGRRPTAQSQSSSPSLHEPFPRPATAFRGATCPEPIGGTRAFSAGWSWPSSRPRSRASRSPPRSRAARSAARQGRQRSRTRPGQLPASQPATPTMTAEAWVCRQFLGVGGPGR